MNQSSSGQFAWQGINNEKYGSSRVLVEAADSRADHSSNMLILRESISAWRADLGQEAHIPRKPSKSQKYLINYWSIILEPNFSIPKWTLIVIQSKKDILTILADFRNIFVVVITLTIAIVVLLSAYQIRRNLIPIEKIIEGISILGIKF
ncbi:MAG: hypothetical protein H6976_00525 [Gammaproteobacteria bacterium]|nr:hypothetical protein [Gammaproteobacteria bacterium]